MATTSAFYVTGLETSIKAIIHNTDLEFADVVSDPHAMESYNAANIDNYDIACTEIGETGEYHATWPSWLVAGTYQVQFVLLATAGSIVQSDLVNRFAVANWYWDGTDLTPATPVSSAPTVSQIWTAEDRALSGTAAANGPTAATTSTDGLYTVPAGGTLGLYKRVRHWSGDDITQADITSITYSIYGLDCDNEDTRNEVTGHVDSAVSISATIYDAIQTDSAASDYNFKFIPSIVTDPAFEDVGTTYLVEFTSTPASGEVIVERFRVTAI